MKNDHFTDIFTFEYVLCVLRVCTLCTQFSCTPRCNIITLSTRIIMEGEIYIHICVFFHSQDEENTLLCQRKRILFYNFAVK